MREAMVDALGPRGRMLMRLGRQIPAKPLFSFSVDVKQFCDTREFVRRKMKKKKNRKIFAAAAGPQRPPSRSAPAAPHWRTHATA